MLKRVLIANRGEIALRVLRACRELDIETVAVYSEADAEALHVQLATQAVCIGPAKAADSYLNQDALLTVAQATGCDGVHPGYGFLSENADFADACARAGLTFIGPSGDTIRKAGSKSAARDIMRAAGVPASLSNTAGTFVCNHLMYGLLDHLSRTGRNIPAGFIHLPATPAQAAERPSPSMSPETAAKGLAAAINALILK